MRIFTVSATGISKAYQPGKWVFSDINAEFHNGETIGITGSNGSGKSTLLKILSGIIIPTSGTIEYKVDDKIIEQENYYSVFGFAAPYLNVYDEFTPTEHLKLLSKMRGMIFDSNIAEDTLKRVKLFNRRNELIRTFSSGMKQRFKLAQAIFHKPEILFLDEPSTNLDAAGIKLLEDIVSEQKSRNGSIIIATNDALETSWCDRLIRLSGNNL